MAPCAGELRGEQAACCARRREWREERPGTEVLGRRAQREEAAPSPTREGRHGEADAVPVDDGCNRLELTAEAREYSIIYEHILLYIHEKLE